MGVRSNNISNRVSVSDELIVNRDGNTGVQLVSELATQLAASGPISDRISAAAVKWVTFSTQAVMNTDLNWPDGQEARVYGTGSGVYRKTGASGAGTWVYQGPLPEADTTALQAQVTILETDKADQTYVEEVEGEALGVPFLDPVYSDGFAASDGRTMLLGFRMDGTVDVHDTYTLLSGEWLYTVVASDAQSVLWGIRFDGSFYPSGTAASPGAEGSIYAKNGDIIVYRYGRRAQITFDGGPYFAPTISGDFATYLSDNGDVVQQIVEEIKASVSLLTVTSILHYIIYGQSLAYGTSGTPIQTSQPVRPGRAAMFNVGPRINGGEDAAAKTPDENRRSLVDLKEINAETPSSGLAAMLTAVGALAANEGILASVHARGSTVYLDLKKGTGPYANILSASRRARVIAELNGLDYDVRYVSWIHGETDRDKSEAVYKGYLVELQADLTADLNAISGKSGDVILVCDQTSSWTASGQTTSEVPFAQLAAALESGGKILCVGPKYPFDHRSDDGIHLPGPSSRRLGCYHGRAVREHRAGRGWRPLRCAGVTRTGATIRLTMDIPTPPLVIDTAAVSNPGNYGITWSQVGGTTRTISNVAVSGSEIVVTLTGDPGAMTSGTIGIAAVGVAGALGGPMSGARSNFRDSSTELDAGGVAMPNWACHQKIMIS